MGLAHGVLLAAAIVATSCGEALADVACVQQELARLGYDLGPIDGAIGQKTRTAAREFQRTAPFLDDLSRKSSPTWCKLLQSQPADPMAGGMFPVDAPTTIHGSTSTDAVRVTPVLGVTPEYQLPKWWTRR